MGGAAMARACRAGGGGGAVVPAPRRPPARRPRHHPRRGRLLRRTRRSPQSLRMWSGRSCAGGCGGSACAWLPAGLFVLVFSGNLGLTSLELCAAFSRFNGFRRLRSHGGRRRTSAGGAAGSSVSRKPSAAIQRSCVCQEATPAPREAGNGSSVFAPAAGATSPDSLLQVGAAGSGAGSVSGGTGSSAAAAGEGSGVLSWGVFFSSFDASAVGVATMDSNCAPFPSPGPGSFDAVHWACLVQVEGPRGRTFVRILLGAAQGLAELLFEGYGRDPSRRRPRARRCPSAALCLRRDSGTGRRSLCPRQPAASGAGGTESARSRRQLTRSESHRGSGTVSLCVSLTRPF